MTRLLSEASLLSSTYFFNDNRRQFSDASGRVPAVRYPAAAHLLPRAVRHLGLAHGENQALDGSAGWRPAQPAGRTSLHALSADFGQS